MFVSRVEFFNVPNCRLTNVKKSTKINKGIQTNKGLELPLAYGFISFKSRENLNGLSAEESENVFKKISELAQDESSIMKGSLGRVYKVDLPNRPSLAVKEFSNIYEGRNPSLEAKTLKKMPKDCKRVQKFVDLLEKDGKQYLITTFQSGTSLSKLKDSMSDKIIANILDELFKIEKSGMAFYDYSMANIVYEADEPRFYDFEVAKEQSLTKPNNDALSDLCHISRNIEFPMITNLAGFEIRTVGKIIGELEKYSDGEERSNKFVARYLSQVSDFYGKTAELFKEKKLINDAEITDEAIEYSKILSNILKNPVDEVISIERQSMRIKELLTEYWFRNDPDLDHDDALYNDGPRYVENLKQRFRSVQGAILELTNSTKDAHVKLYCQNTSKLLDMIEKKEVSYLTRKLCK